MLIIKIIPKIRICFLITLLFIFISEVSAESHYLSLQEYLCQVRKCNRGVEGSVLTAKGACQRVGEGKLLMEPTFFAQAEYLKNSYNPNWSPVPGNRTSLETYQAGISETTPLGVQGKVYYNYQRQTINGIPPLNNTNHLTSSTPILELNVPLSRNFAGRETRAMAQLIDSRARLTHYSEKYKNSQLMAQAESAYWRLATLRCVIGKQKESLDRAERIREWAMNRLKRRLSEESDLLQAGAAVEAKRLDLQTAINDMRIAAINFNTLRGSCLEMVWERLSSLPVDIPLFSLPCPPGIRDDIRAAKAQEQLAIADAKIGIEKNKPVLDLYASYALNGKNPSTDDAIAESFRTDYPSTSVGLRLNLPLDLIQLHRDRAGYRNEIRGANYQFQQKVFENERLWQELVQRVQNANKRLIIAKKLEQIQCKKLQAERERLQYGKTTTYQVLLFEQDYQNAQIASLWIQDEIFELLAQLKTFGA